MRQQCDNAQRLAEWLEGHPLVGKVNYPGLVSHPQHNVAGRLFGDKGFGGMISFEIARADQAAAFRFLEALELCLPATTLGDIYTLMLHPASSSHRSLSAAERDRIGISDGLLRLSVGIEDANDIIADLERALQSLRL
jgi:cystathionine beta-lyase/cystathionine gamma-synthase